MRMGTTVGVVGTGNMGAALVKGWLRDPTPDQSLVIYDVVQQRVDELAGLGAGLTVAASLKELARACRVMVLVVKPKDIAAVLAQVQADFDDDTIIVSCAAGVTVDDVRGACGPGPAVFRIMPNLGVELGQGVVAVATESQTAPQTTQTVLDLLSPLGLVALLDEDSFDAVTAASGSSIAFLALALEGMEDGAVRAGLARPTARAFVRQTALAGALLLRHHEGSAADIKDQVSSPGGTTIAGLAVLEDAGMRGVFLRAVEEAAARSRDMREAGRRHQ